MSYWIGSTPETIDDSFSNTAVVRHLGSRPGLHGVVGLPLAFLQLVLLAGSSFLHSHHGKGRVSADLPAEFHHHDFQISEGGDEGLDFFDGCIGCRMERSRDAAAPTRVECPDGDLVSGIPASGPTIPLDKAYPRRLPRAPPISLTA